MNSNHPNFIAGQSAYKNQEFDKAASLFTSAIKQEENPEIYYQRAMCFFYLKDKESCIADFDYLVKLENDRPFWWSCRAYAKDKFGDTLGAIEDYETAIKLDPEDAVATNNLGILMEKAGYQEQAKKLVKRADELGGAVEYLEHQRQQQKIERGTASVDSKPPTVNADVDYIDAFKKKETWKAYWQFLKNGFK